MGKNNKNQKNQESAEPIELRTTINPEDPLFSWLNRVRNHLATGSKSHLVRFIVSKSKEIPFEEFIHLGEEEIDENPETPETPQAQVKE